MHARNSNHTGLTKHCYIVPLRECTTSFQDLVDVVVVQLVEAQPVIEIASDEDCIKCSRVPERNLRVPSHPLVAV